MAPDTRRAIAARATRVHLLDTARTLFNGHPYADVTMRMIARTAKLSTGAIFTHWADKDALYLEAIGHKPITPEQGRQLLALATRLGGGTVAWRVVHDPS